MVSITFQTLGQRFSEENIGQFTPTVGTCSVVVLIHHDVIEVNLTP